MTSELEAEHAFGTSSAVRRYRLSSGLRILFLTDRSAPIVSYQTWFRVGSRHEEPGRTGMAHLFEHLMFNRTKSLARGELDRLIESTGGDTNAATWTDWTYYRVSVPARDLELAVRLEADRMRNLLLEAEQVECEREVVMNERLERVDNDVEGFLEEQLFRTAFTRHPYCWPTIGWMEDIRALTEADVRRFYRTYYAPNNASLVVVGDIDEAHAIGLVERYYGDLEPAEIPPESSEPEPPQTEERRARFSKPVAADRAVFGYKSPPQDHPDWAITELLCNLLAGSPSARLYRRLVVDEPIASAVEGHVFPFRDPALLQLSVNLRRGYRAAAAEAALDEAAQRLRVDLVTEEELARVRNRVETEFWADLATCDGKAEALGHFESALDDFRKLFVTAERLGNAAPEDLRRVARTLFDDSQRTAIIVEPEERQ